MKNRRSLFIIILITPFLGLGQNKMALNLNCYNISATNWKSFDVKQVEIFGSILRRRDILIVSEPDHGFGSAYDVQCMLMKTLIDSCKIKSVYIESSWINCERIMGTLQGNSKNAIEEAKKYIYSYDLKYWTNNGFWDY